MPTSEKLIQLSLIAHERQDWTSLNHHRAFQVSSALPPFLTTLTPLLDPLIFDAMSIRHYLFSPDVLPALLESPSHPLVQLFLFILPLIDDPWSFIRYKSGPQSPFDIVDDDADADNGVPSFSFKEEVGLLKAFVDEFEKRTEGKHAASCIIEDELWEGVLLLGWRSEEEAERVKREEWFVVEWEKCSGEEGWGETVKMVHVKLVKVPSLSQGGSREGGAESR